MTSLVKLKTYKPWIIWSLWRNELDTYIRREVPVLERDEAKILTPEELSQGQEDHCWFNHESPCTTSVFPKYTKINVWFLDQAIWREEHKSKCDFEKTIEKCESPKCRIKENIWSGKTRSEECRSGDSHLEWPPRIMGFIHARNVWLLSVDSRKRTHKKKKLEKRRWEQLKIKLLPSKEDPSSDEEYEDLNSWRTSYPS